MQKIKDRIVLGCVSGLLGNIAKDSICVFIAAKGVSCPERAAAIFVNGKKVNTPKGTLIGALADNIVAGIMGVASVYMLSITGKDAAIIKGAGLGAASWHFLSGVLPSLGVTGRVRKVTPVNALFTLVSNVVFGVTTSLIAIKIGDDRLFNGETPLIPNRSDAVCR